jgi:uncharacterized RDD family membrane protein YckC
VHPDERLKIDTPEQIALELPVAGIGSRFLAVAVDTLLQVALYIVPFIGALAFSRTFAAGLPAFFATIGPAVSILAAFCAYWGYFAVFETFWGGQTPGKRLAHIRVVKESGRPINGYEAVARNVLRAIDFLPALYGVGLVVMMLNRNSRRIGDYVAGTYVVHDRAATGMRPAWLAAAPASGPTEQLARVTVDELVLIETFLQRRDELDPLVRYQMANQIADRIERKTGMRRDPAKLTDEFLESMARQIRDSTRLR